MVRWFDHWLKDVDNGVEREPTVRYYVMGAVGETSAPGNEWQSAEDWPSPAKPSRFYLLEQGRLSESPPTSSSDGTRYTSNPLEPMEINGRAFPGAKDRAGLRGTKRGADLDYRTTERAVEDHGPSHGRNLGQVRRSR